MILLLAGLGKTLSAQNIYSVASIPKELMPYASAVVRNEETTVEVKALDNVIYHVKRAVTILNKNGDDEAEIAIFYDKTRAIKEAAGFIYDEYGTQIAKFSEGGFVDESAAHDFSLFEDSRVKLYKPPVSVYPYTIIYEYEVRSKQSLTFRDWRPDYSNGTSVEKSSYTFICKPDFKFRYKERNMPGKMTEGSRADGTKTYAWDVKNLKATRQEPYSPAKDVYGISLRIAPENFKYSGISGTFTGWDDLGKWEYDKLLSTRNALPSATAAYISSITATIANPKDKARKIYEYMQQKTHYISVQVGIGGYQPFLASEVDQLNYGDCKALVNYTQALLKAANIDSWYCVVQAGSDNKTSMLTDFASMNQGNHVILCIPFKNDTTWLECTNQKIPFGFLGDFTDDRIVLACTPNGGKLMRTPKYTASKNFQGRKAELTINNEGELSGKMETFFKGTQYENREFMVDKSETERLRMLGKVYAINNLVVNKYELTQSKTDTPRTAEMMAFSARDYAAVNGEKMYFMLNPANRSTRAPAEIRNRTTALFINEGYTDEDEIKFTIPAGYHLEKIPLAVSINKPFGSYQAQMILTGQTLSYHRKIQLIDGLYDKAMYDELVDFYKKVNSADEYSVSLVKGIN